MRRARRPESSAKFGVDLSPPLPFSLSFSVEKHDVTTTNNLTRTERNTKISVATVILE